MRGPRPPLLLVTDNARFAANRTVPANLRALHFRWTAVRARPGRVHHHGARRAGPVQALEFGGGGVQAVEPLQARHPVGMARMVRMQLAHAPPIRFPELLRCAIGIDAQLVIQRSEV